MMTRHNTTSHTRQDVMAMTDKEIYDLMAGCDSEPADFDDCTRCFAFLVSQWRHEPDPETKKLMEELLPGSTQGDANQLVRVMVTFTHEVEVITDSSKTEKEIRQLALNHLMEREWEIDDADITGWYYDLD